MRSPATAPAPVGLALPPPGREATPEHPANGIETLLSRLLALRFWEAETTQAYMQAGPASIGDHWQISGSFL